MSGRPQRRPGPRPTVAELAVTALGGGGDGIARLDGAPVYIPFTAPGDRVRARLTARRDGSFAGEVVERLETGPDRATPACAHFEACGGCAVQHLAEPAYAAWKLETLRTALARQGFGEVPIEPMVRTPPASRRRARLAAIGRRDGVVLGFNAAASHRVVDLAACPVLTPRLAALLSPLRSLLSAVLAPGQRLDVEALDLGGTVDLGFVAEVRTDLALHEALAGFAAREDIARITWRRADGDPAEPVVQRGAVRARFGDLDVDLPPGAFLQASAAGEAALAGFVRRWIAASTRILELFAGAGTFTLPLAAAGAQVTAYEGNGAMVAALSGALRRHGLDRTASVRQRDLVRSPLLATELAGIDGVLLDPPRAGAAEQVEGIVESAVSRVVYVSCNPISFARDARRLAAGRFRLERVLPVDQFLWSPHLEVAALLRR